MLARVTQAEQLAAQAAQWQAAGRADMAAQLYGAALEQDPSKFAIRMQLAECLALLGQADHAAEQYLMVAQAYAARGRQQECLAICERVLVIAPHAFVYMTVGPMVRRIGRQARPICARAAEAHLAAGRQTDGLQMLRLGAELDPHNPDVRRQLARIYQARHMQREAVEALSDAANLLLQAKRYDDYVEVAEQILTLEPRDLETLRDLPRVYLELRKPHDAVRTLGRLTKASPGDIIGYEILAQAFALIGRVDKALSVLERLVEELGATGQADKADAILNHARYWRPTDVGFLRSLKRMEIPRPAAAPERPAPRAAAPEGTVVLSIADLLVDEGSKRAAKPSSRGVQLTEAEGTLDLRLDDLIVDELEQAAGKGVAPSRPPPGGPPPPPARRGQPPAPPRGSAGPGRASEAPRRDPAPRPAQAGPRRSVEAPVDATMALDAADLIEALTGEVPRSAIGSPRQEAITQPDRGEATELLSTDGTFPPHALDGVSPTLALQLDGSVDEESTTVPPPPARQAAPGRSMSDLIYDDDDAETDADMRRVHARRDEEESDAETLLHMKPLTAADIDRALAKQAAAKAQAQAPAAWSVESPPSIPFPRLENASPRPTSMQAEVDLDATTVPPASSARSQAGTLDEMPTVPPPSRGIASMGDDAPTMFPASAHASGMGDDSPTMFPGSARPSGMGDDAPTMARLSPLTAADIARALSQRAPTRPPPPQVSEDAVTVPPPSMHAPVSREPARVDPDEPPLLPPLLPPGAAMAPHDDDESEEEEMLTITMDALRPEDLLRGPGGGRGGGPGRS